jgi:RNA polymerase sigma-54 factor
MKPTLSLKLGQQLTMTPQLQQAIRLLQLSTLDLQQEIQQVIESNPMLELEDDYRDAAMEQLTETVTAGGEAGARRLRSELGLRGTRLRGLRRSADPR